MRTLVAAVLLLVASPMVGCGPVRQFEPCQNQQCANCKGTGTYRCTVCSGAGYMRCKGNPFMGGCDNGTLQCGVCNGSGLYLQKQCTNCNGRGRKNCTTCQGTARASCDTCNGGMTRCGRWVAVKEK